MKTKTDNDSGRLADATREKERLRDETQRLVRNAQDDLDRAAHHVNLPVRDNPNWRDPRKA